MNVRRVEYQPGDVAGNRKSRRHPGCEFCIADTNAGEADAAEVIDPLDVGRQQAWRRWSDVDEFGAHADLDLRARGQTVVAPLQCDGVAVDPGFAALNRGGHDVHARRADEVADKGVFRLG